MTKEIKIYTLNEISKVPCSGWTCPAEYIRSQLPNIKTTPDNFEVHIYYKPWNETNILHACRGIIHGGFRGPDNWVVNHNIGFKTDSEKIIITVRRAEKIQTHDIKTITLGCVTVIRTISIRVKCKGDLQNPKSNPKIVYPTGVIHIDGNGATRKSSIVLSYKEGKLFWKDAPFKALNSEEFEKKIAEALND
jgi:hypothetical protein